MAADTTNLKYELIDEPRMAGEKVLLRIRALRDIPRYNVKKGDLGGFVESETNLSHEGNCWVDDEAYVYEEAHVSGEAFVCEEARVSGRARVTECACISGRARVHDGEPHISGNAVISGVSRIYGRVRVSGNACIDGDSHMGGGANISGNARISFDIEGVSDSMVIDMNIPIDGAAEITDKRHVFYMGPVGQENWHFLAYRIKGGGACIKRSRSGFMSDDSLEIMDENHEDWQRSDECRTLFDMLRDPAGNSHGIESHDEISFAVQMMLARNAELNRCNLAGEDESCTEDAENKLSVGMVRKYELTNEGKAIGLGLDPHTVYRIRALRDIPRYGIKAGDLGGFVESESNLSHEGDCWVGDEACVYEEARVEDNALVSGEAVVSGLARVCEAAEATGHVRIDDKARVCGKVRMSVASLAGDAEVSNDRHIFLVGPVGSDHDYWISAYRAKGGNICIRRKLSSFIHWYDECQPVRLREDYSFLYELARTQPENWLDIEYGFMLQMMKNRIEEWKQDA